MFFEPDEPVSLDTAYAELMKYGTLQSDGLTRTYDESYQANIYKDVVIRKLQEIFQDNATVQYACGFYSKRTPILFFTRTLILRLRERGFYFIRTLNQRAHYC